MRPLRPLPSKKIEWKWEEEQETAFQEIERTIRKNHGDKTLKKETTCMNKL